MRSLILAAALLLSLATSANAAPVTVHALIRTSAGVAMPNTPVDVIVSSTGGSAAFISTTDANGYVWFDAAVGDEVTVRAGSDCHSARRVVAVDAEPLLVTPVCAVWLPIVHGAPADVDAATRFWGG